MRTSEARTSTTLSSPPSGDRTALELWRDRRHAAGTLLVKEHRAGNGSCPSDRLTNVDGTLFFAANDGDDGRRALEKRRNRSRHGSGERHLSRRDRIPPSYLVNVAGTLYFHANDGVTGIELWKSDGTAAGTTLVVDIDPGDDRQPPNLTDNVAGKLFFAATDDRRRRGNSGRAMATAAGTSRVQRHSCWDGGSTPCDVHASGRQAALRRERRRPWPRTLDQRRNRSRHDAAQRRRTGRHRRLHPAPPVNVNGIHYFVANDGVHGHELWRTDGTAAGTTLVERRRSRIRSVANLLPDERRRHALLRRQRRRLRRGVVAIRRHDRRDSRWSEISIPVAGTPRRRIVRPPSTALLYFTADDGVLAPNFGRATARPQEPPRQRRLFRTRPLRPPYKSPRSAEQSTSFAEGSGDSARELADQRSNRSSGARRRPSPGHARRPCGD